MAKKKTFKQVQMSEQMKDLIDLVANRSFKSTNQFIVDILKEELSNVKLQRKGSVIYVTYHNKPIEFRPFDNVQEAAKITEELERIYKL